MARMNWCIRRGIKVIYCDETGFNAKDIKKRTFAAPNERCFVPAYHKHTRNVSIFAAIDERGLVYKKKIEGYLNTGIYLNILDELAKKMRQLGHKRWALFFDGLAVHVS